MFNFSNFPKEIIQISSTIAKKKSSRNVIAVFFMQLFDIGVQILYVTSLAKFVIKLK